MHGLFFLSSRFSSARPARERFDPRGRTRVHASRIPSAPEWCHRTTAGPTGLALTRDFLLHKVCVNGRLRAAEMDAGFDSITACPLACRDGECTCLKYSVNQALISPHGLAVGYDAGAFPDTRIPDTRVAQPSPLPKAPKPPPLPCPSQAHDRTLLAGQVLAHGPYPLYSPAFATWSGSLATPDWTPIVAPPCSRARGMRSNPVSRCKRIRRPAGCVSGEGESKRGRRKKKKARLPHTHTQDLHKLHFPWRKEKRQAGPVYETTSREDPN